MAAKEYGEVIGFLLARLDERDKAIEQFRIQQQLTEAVKQSVSETTTEHPSIMVNKTAHRR